MARVNILMILCGLSKTPSVATNNKKRKKTKIERKSTTEREREREEEKRCEFCVQIDMGSIRFVYIILEIFLSDFVLLFCNELNDYFFFCLYVS